MKRSTAVKHLEEMAQLAADMHGRLQDSEIPWPLEEFWVTGELLTFADDIDTGAVVLVLDVPPEKAPWLAINSSGEWIGEMLHLRRRPMQWCYRPLAWPVWNHEHRRLVRVYSARAGLDDAVIAGLKTRRFERLEVVEPTTDALVSQLEKELIVSRRHLRDVLQRYWTPAWRRKHKGHDQSPEDHLWRAATGVADMEDALDQLRS